MEIILENISRNFGPQVVIKNLNFHFLSGNSYAILGGNGSGKSTVLRLVYGALTPSEGTVIYKHKDEVLNKDKVPFEISLAGPYLELIEELTAREFLNFYYKFRKPLNGLSADTILETCQLTEAANKEIRNFSSGMKQRLRLGLAFLTQSKVVLLDEPTSNLDPLGIEWYRDLVAEHLNGRTLLIGSNHQEKEMDFCQHRLEAQDWR